jgi:hypothetical protein
MKSLTMRIFSLSEISGSSKFDIFNNYKEELYFCISKFSYLNATCVQSHATCIQVSCKLTTHKRDFENNGFAQNQMI